MTQIEFVPTPIDGVWLLEPKRFGDPRGFFAAGFKLDDFEEQGLSTNIRQLNFIYNEHRGTLRGMHYQIPPREEAKVIRCVRGRIFDVVMDIRPTSPSFRKWFGVELAERTYRSIYLPEGVAHGYLTLEDQVEVNYLVSEFYSPECYRGLRWNDPTFDVRWPIEPTTMHDRDRSYPDFAS